MIRRVWRYLAEPMHVELPSDPVEVAGWTAFCIGIVVGFACGAWAG